MSRPALAQASASPRAQATAAAVPSDVQQVRDELALLK
jgi:hypothetical protein